MKINKNGWLFGPIQSWLIADKIEAHKRKKRTKHGSDAIDNIERLYRLKGRGVISEADFEELKEKLKEQI